MQRKYILPLLLFIQILFLQLISFFPELVERYYSNGLYFYISKFSRISFGSFPFSIGDCIYFVVVFLILKWFYQQRKLGKLNWKYSTFRLLSFLSVFFFPLFRTCCIKALYCFIFLSQFVGEK